MKPTVDDYIASEPAATRAMLEQIRSIIKSVVPEGTEETVSYMVPSYKYHGMLVGFGARKDGCSFYAMSTTILGEFEKELKGLKYSGSTVHFDLGSKLPATLIKKIIKQRIKHNTERALVKQQLKTKKIKQ